MRKNQNPAKVQIIMWEEPNDPLTESYTTENFSLLSETENAAQYNGKSND